MQTDILEITRQQRLFFEQGVTLPLAFRLAQLKKLRSLLKENTPQLLDALRKDTGKSETEGYLSEIGPLLAELRLIIRNLPRWGAAKKMPTPFFLQPARGHVYFEPLGLVLVISPWNYPLMLGLSPVFGSLAAGNCTVLKMSSNVPETARALARLINENFDPRHISVLPLQIKGEEALKGDFNHIFFTGSTATGRAVQKAAAERLIPTTLELGGKSPCIVAKDADLKNAARRIVWGKLLNAGQTCVAPDHLFVPVELCDELIEHMRLCAEEFYGQHMLSNPDYARLINNNALNRLKTYLSDGSILLGGNYSDSECKMEFTVLSNPNPESKIMQEEIFGPILPVIAYNEIEEVLSTIKAGPKPLALYLFTRSPELEKRIVGQVPYGNGCINDVMVQVSCDQMPFGGVGESGMGRYHGYYTFERLSNSKSVLKRQANFDLPLRFPPYGALASKLLRFIVR